MYEPGTILTLKEPQSTDDKTYAYDRVQVVGQSPVQHVSSSGSSWAGPDATGYIIRPLDEHAPTLDKPYGELERVYEIESYPIDPITQQPITPENNPRNVPSPMQVLRAAEEGRELPQQRKPLPSVQSDVKSPVQVLREGEDSPAVTRRKKAS
jgi:hypothetical protein